MTNKLTRLMNINKIKKKSKVIHNKRFLKTQKQ